MPLGDITRLELERAGNVCRHAPACKFSRMTCDFHAFSARSTWKCAARDLSLPELNNNSGWGTSIASEFVAAPAEFDTRLWI